jgi:peptidoglycan hydrolase-like protein with peptidoglycan-binding domain
MSGAWRLAPSLVSLRSEINGKWPNRDKRSDGTVGNAEHSSRVSDHNPNERDLVNAIDIDVDGINVAELIAAYKKHPSTNYYIYNRKIFSSRFKFIGRPYFGANQHKSHVHLSIKQTIAAEQSRVAWFTEATTTWPLPRYLFFGNRADAKGPRKLVYVDGLGGYGKYRWPIEFIQQEVGAPITGIFDAKTESAVKAWQARQKIPVTGYFGRKEWDLATSS